MSKEASDILYSASQIGQALFTRELRCVAANAAMRRFFGLKSPDSLPDLAFPPPQFDQLAEVLQRTIEQNQTLHPEIEINGRLYFSLVCPCAGTPDSIEPAIALFLGEAASNKRFNGTHPRPSSRLIELIESQEEQLANLEDRFNLLLEGADGAVVEIDLDRRIISWSALAEEMLGFNADEIAGASFDEILAREDRVAFDEEFEKTRSSGKPRYLHARAVDKSGIELRVSLMLYRLCDKRGNPSGVLILARLRGEESATTSDLLPGMTKPKDPAIRQARKYQMHRVPRRQFFGNVGLHCFLAAAEDLSGDFSEAFLLHDGRLAFFVGDVGMKGVGAAFKGIDITSYLQGRLLMHGDPSRSLLELNRRVLSLQTLEDRWTATCLVGVLDMQTLELTVSSAGHEHPLIFEPELGEVRQFGENGLTLGIFPDITYPTVKTTLRPGNKLLIFTDGLCDLQSPEGEMLRRSRVQGLFRGKAHLHPEKIRSELIESISRFMEDQGLFDDLLFLILSIVEEPVLKLEIPGVSQHEAMEQILAETQISVQDEEWLQEWRLAVDEMLSNAFTHGRTPGEEAEVEVQLFREKELMRCRVLDKGPGFNPATYFDAVRENALTSYKGRGIRLARTSVDAMFYSREGNEVTLEKMLPETGDAES